MNLTLSQFLAGIKAGETTGVASPYDYMSSTGAIGAYGLTGGFIQTYAPGAGLPTDRAIGIGNQANQDALAGYAAQQMYNQYGSWGSVANAWLTGSPTATTSAPGNMTPSAYVSKVLNAAAASPAGGGAVGSGGDSTGPTQENDYATSQGYGSAQMDPEDGVGTIGSTPVTNGGLFAPLGTSIAETPAPSGSTYTLGAAPTGGEPQGVGVNGTAYDAQGNYVGYVSSADTYVPNNASTPATPAAPSAPDQASITAMPDNSGYPSGVPGGLQSDYYNGGGGQAQGSAPNAPGVSADGTTGDSVAPMDGDSGPLSMGLMGGDPGAAGSGSIGEAGQSLGQFGNMAGITGIAGSIPGPAGQIAGQLSSVLGAGTSPDAAQGAATGSNMGAPVDITDAPNVGTSAANTISKATSQGAGTVAKGLTSSSGALVTGAAADTSQITGEGTGLTQYLGNLTYDILPRIVVGIGGVILIGAGLWMVGKKMSA
jgi:hypothetical protein